ncbi:pyridoxamine 5'-phosphate oxidase family protein [Novosphingobium sp. Leaf2]|uniref:pyridoxamine 5'-phosphate oxidase family protein n=1 Tax=Novosphingobium sp. Leaf2 TaxID=1735670 RepID=UPI0006F87C02|nr:pyridoxamine 5'-phosphate oxidase family protein [Novosphingobium sp. Leaf2]KQM18895.1 general stress protein [Novosphingobium sp. Leaf2]
MDKEISDTFWKSFSASPFIMMKLNDASGHAEPMTAMLDKDAHHAIWFFAKRDNRIAGGGKAMGQVMTKGHDVFACISGTLVEETDRARREAQWNNAVEAWFPGGKDDASVEMLRFDIEDGEVWTAELGLKGMFKLLTGKPIQGHEAGDHAVGAV